MEQKKDVLYSFFGDEKFPVEWESEEEKRLHFWFDDAHTPNPLTPLYGSLHNAMAWEVTCTYGLTRLALPSTKGVKAKLVNGYVYPAMVPTTEEEAKELAPIHNLVLPYYLKNLPRLWNEQYEPELKRNLAHLEPDNYDKADLSELIYWLDEAVEIGFRHMCIHWYLNLTQFISFLIYDGVYQEQIGDSPEEIRNLPLKTYDDKNMEVLKAIWELKEKVKEKRELQEIFEKDSSNILTELEKEYEGRRFLKSLENFLKNYGNKAIYVFEFINPSWREDPTPVIELIKSYLEIDYNYPVEVKKIAQERETAVKEAISKIKSEEGRKKFIDALETAYALSPITPNHHFYIDQWTPVAIRRVFVKIGDRLTESDVLNKADDIFFLTLDQVKSIMSDPDAFDAKNVVQKARKTWEEQAKLSPPPNLGTITEASANDVVKIKLWGWTLPKEKEIVKNQLRGVAASPGIIEGVAKVVKSPKEFGLVEKGDILVCDLTNPAWTPLFTKISGVVTNSGGILAHPGILSREFKIPCVVGTVHATKAIRSGQKIKVDGSKGTVEILG